ncbi:MAG: response regulator transcription factor [Chloroflexi bacterium]|jgi:DNA-binding response OmpR family regulator|nr:MAG: response regulator transcription factor [Chloroflexota bacterium]
MLRNRAPVLPPLPPGLEVYRPAEVLGSRVLVVDDEVPMQMQLQLDLNDLGYQPKVAGSADAARDLLTRERMSGVVLDLVLDEGEESGFELLRWIRQHHPGLPVIVLSAAQVSSAAIRKAYEHGASSYFVKGNVPMAHIYSDLAARLVETGTGRSGSYIFGRLEFDPTKRTMSVGSRNTRLTPQQTALVVHLAQGSKPATAGDLINAGLFRPDAARSTVHSALLTLRRKLDELEPSLGSRFLLSTARGYSLGTII